MRRRSTTKILAFCLLPTFTFSSSTVVAQAEDKSSENVMTTSDGFRFAPRDDERAPMDLKELRWMLSQMDKEQGNKNPLSDYVEKPSTAEERAKRKEWKEDDEAHATPKLFKNPSSDYVSPNVQPVLPNVRSTDSNSGSKTSDGTTQRARVESVYDPCYIPILKRPAIPTKLVSSNSNRTSFQPEIPFSSQPTTLPGIGGASLPGFGTPSPGGVNPVLPNNGMALPPAGLGGAATTTPTYNPSGMGTAPYSSPTTVGPAPIMGNPIASPNNPTMITPSPSGYSNSPLTGPGIATSGGTVMPAPPATYAPVNGLGGNVSSPSYAPGGGIVNSQPFVSAPPCQKDARYMVSPTLYRQSVGCNTCGGDAYAPTGSNGTPFSYAPRTYFPSSFNGYASQYRPLIGLGQDVRSAQLGRGIIGQPVAYMPSQPLRNVLRYLFP